MSVYDELVGQDRVVAQIRQAAEAAARVVAGRRAGAGRGAGAGDGAGMTHAWLFTGPPGSGRSVAARAFAAALQCRHQGTSEQGCGTCDACHQVLVGSHADLELIRPSGLSYSVKQTRELVLRSSTAPSSGNWQIVLFEDADRATEQAANALLKAIEEPPERTVWLLCTPSPDDLVVTIRSRCRLVTLSTPPSRAVADVLVDRDGIDPDVALTAARAAQGHIGRARRLATDEAARSRRENVLSIPRELRAIDACLNAADRLVKAAEAEAAATTAELDDAEKAELRKAFGEGATGKGVTKAVRGSAGAMRALEDRQKSRATRLKRDALDRTLMDLAGYYRDALTVQFDAGVELANAERADELRRYAASSTSEATLRRLEAIMECRKRLGANANPLLAVEAMTLTIRAA